VARREDKRDTRVAIMDGTTNGAPDGIVLEEDTSRKDPEKDFQLLEKLGEGYDIQQLK
jgi:hypothetical protein